MWLKIASIQLQAKMLTSAICNTSVVDLINSVDVISALQINKVLHGDLGVMKNSLFCTQTKRGHLGTYSQCLKKKKDFENI